jgi:hypothetical protein
MKRCISRLALLVTCAFTLTGSYAFKPAPGEWETRMSLNGEIDKPRRQCFRGDEVDKFMAGNEDGMFRRCKRRDLKRGATELSASYDCERGTGDMKFTLISADRLQGNVVMRETNGKGKDAVKITTLTMSAKRIAAVCSKKKEDDDDAD